MKMAEPNKIENRSERQARRRWNCPDEATIGAYIDGSLGEQASGRLVNHLADCGYCRELVAATVKLQSGEEPAEVPASLMQRARALGEAQTRQWSWRRVWRWAPASSAAAALACAGLILAVWRAPQEAAIPKQPAPTSPAIAKFEPMRAGETAQSEQERKPKGYETAPTMIAPQPGQVMSRKNLKFSWAAVPTAVGYQVRVVTLEGDLVWEGSSGTTGLRVPGAARLPSGKYFVMVSATMGNGRTHKASPVEFQVTDAQ